jgi:DNA invertase Pin-like site-specific DNA recombinase
MIVGYARVSTNEQDLTLQLEALARAGAEKVFSEKVSATQGSRTEFARCIEFVRDGDTLVVTRLDRFARSSLDLHNTMAILKDKGVGFRSTEQGEFDTTNSMGKFVFAMMGAVAEFETDLRRERQREGIEQAKAQGRYKGSKARIDPQRVRAMLAEGMTPTTVATALGINRASVYRLAR